MNTKPNTNQSEGSLRVSARQIVQQQHDRQKRRRGPAEGRGKGTKHSLWSTIAARMSEDVDDPYFVCMICAYQGKVNKSFSSSNVIFHYKCKHSALRTRLISLDESDASSDVLKNVIIEAQERYRNRKKKASIETYFGGSAGVSTESAEDSFPVPQSTKQYTALVLYACATETPLTVAGSPLMQGLIAAFGGRMKVCSKRMLDLSLLDVYKAVCNLLCSRVDKAATGSLTVDGWRNASGAPILGLSWHYCDESWMLHSIPIASLNIGTTAKTGRQLCLLMEEVLSSNKIVGSENIKVHTVTTDNEAAASLSADFLTNYVGSVRCVVHTIALCVKDAFHPDSTWQRYLDHVNNVTTFFNQNQKAAQRLVEMQTDEDITNDRIKKLKHDIPTRWHSRVGAMLSYLSHSRNIAKIIDELEIEEERMTLLTDHEEDIMSEMVVVLGEVRRVARLLESDRIVTLSRTPRYLRELYHTMKILSGQARTGWQRHRRSSLSVGRGNEDQEFVIPESRASCAENDNQRDATRAVKLRYADGKALAASLAQKLQDRFKSLWNTVTEEAAEWTPGVQNIDDDENGHEEPARELQEPRRALLFHVAALLDVNECELDFMEVTDELKETYFKVLYKAVVREAIELDHSLKPQQDDLTVVLRLFHRQMRAELNSKGRRSCKLALDYWKETNATPSLISPIPFNRIARAMFSSQASSATAERIFSDLGRLEGDQRQSLLSSTSEMIAIIRSFVLNELDANRRRQSDLLHPNAVAFRSIVEHVSHAITKMPRDS